MKFNEFAAGRVTPGLPPPEKQEQEVNADREEAEERRWSEGKTNTIILRDYFDNSV